MAIMGRVPTRPLTYSRVSQAVREELIADYINGELYLKCDDNEVRRIGRGLSRIAATIPTNWVGSTQGRHIYINKDKTIVTLGAGNTGVTSTTTVHVTTPTFKTKIESVMDIYQFAYDGTVWLLDGRENVYTKTLGVANTGITLMSSITFTEATFKTKVGGISGNYIFTYDGTNWKLGTSNVTMSQYGIAIATQTPASGDKITIGFTNTDITLSSYGITLDVSAASGDIINVEYTKRVITKSIAGTGGITAVAINELLFVSAVSGIQGTYTFHYVVPEGEDGAWHLNSATGTTVTLANYGITPTGTAVAGNVITVTYTNEDEEVAISSMPIAPYTLTVPLPGITPTDVIIISPSMDSATATNPTLATALLEEFNKIYAVDTGTNCIILYAMEPTFNDIAILVQINR